MKKKLKQIFLTGLAVTIPIGLTLYILFFLIDIMDGLLKIIPVRYHPDTLLGIHIPGLGIIVTLALITIAGLVTTSYVGYKIVQSGEDLVDRIPFVRNIYQAIKKISDSMFMDKRSSFKKVVLVEFPRKGVYTIGFVTGVPSGEIRKKAGQNCISVFLPTTPNPTSGYLIIVPEDELVPMDMSVEEALTFIISVGIVTPSDRPKRREKLHHEGNHIDELKSTE
ncbi:MAG: DUF502 domain-containing protein [Deltaproteobacteria bacterium]|nr:DUF502 domain-containing protein [Deltaproteobacteria bacterium]